MAERPDLEYAIPIMREALVGRTIVRVTAEKPVVLRVISNQSLEALVLDRKITAIERRAHFAVIATEKEGEPADAAISICFAPMLAGRFVLLEAGKKAPRDEAFTLFFDEGPALVFRDDVQMGKVYVAAPPQLGQIPNFSKIGVDVLSKAFTREAFRAIARTRRDQAKVFLMDKSAIDAFGNAYADEALFEARIHPKAMVRRLDEAALDRLHDAMVLVLSRARDTIFEKKPPLDKKLRDFLDVRGRLHEACVRCGTKLRRTHVHGHDAVFCPTCQPDDRGTSIVDWRNLKGDDAHPHRASGAVPLPSASSPLRGSGRAGGDSSASNPTKKAKAPARARARKRTGPD